MAQANEQQHQPTSACPCTHAHAQVLPRRSIGYDERFSSQCIVRTRATRSSTNCTRSLAITDLRAPCRNPASRHSRCSAKASASGLAGADGPEPTRGARAPRPATSQHRVGRRRRGSDERRRTLVCERASGWPRSPFLELRCRYFLLVRKEGSGLASGLRWRTQIAPDRPHPPSGALPHACQTHRAKNPAPLWATPNRPLCGRRPTAPDVGDAPPPPSGAD